MRVPSGLTSRFIHVPSDVSNASFVVGPRSAATSHLGGAGGPCALVEESARHTIASSGSTRLIVICKSGRQADTGEVSRFVVEAAPEIPRRDGTVRPPRLTDFSNALRGWFLP